MFFLFFYALIILHIFLQLTKLLSMKNSISDIFFSYELIIIIIIIIIIQLTNLLSMKNKTIQR
jgi:hypothetical protein